jgi:hypothetical protein
MKLIWTWIAGLIVVAVLVSPAVAQLNLDLKTTIDVNAAAPRDVFTSISKRLGSQLVIAPEITQPVTMHVENVTVRTALTALSETLACRWVVEGNVLHVETASSAQHVPSRVPGGMGSGLGNGLGGGVGSGAGGGLGSGIGGGVAGDRNWNADVQKGYGRRTPAGFRFDNVPLSTIMNELGKVAGMEISVANPDPARHMTIDLSNRSVGEALRLLALKATKDQMAENKPVIFSLTLQGKRKGLVFSAGETSKSR